MIATIFRLVDASWKIHPDNKAVDPALVNWVLCFGSSPDLHAPLTYTSLREKFPAAHIVMFSTAGEIYQTEVLDETMIAVAIHFDKTTLEARSVNINNYTDTFHAAMALGKDIPKKDLRYVFVISDGNMINGTALINGLTSQLDRETIITGGLAGDGTRFETTYVGLNSMPKTGEIVAIALYGQHINITHGSQSGWDVFGLEKRVTNAYGNVLEGLEGKNALDVYKTYLGPASAQLPGAALLFPLSVVLPGGDKPLVRTILSINEQTKVLTFAGEIPIGSKVKFMKADMQKLTAAASEAAKDSLWENKVPDFALFISCIGRKLVLGEHSAEEIEAVNRVFAHQVPLAGFYSYGELAPFNSGGQCQLHNQTATITSFYEI